jgi:hypothetical protein
MKTALLSALALATMTSFALAEPVTLTANQLDGITAGQGAFVVKEFPKEFRESRVDVIYLPNGRIIEPGRD